MSAIFAALNPHISNAQLIELIEAETANKLRTIKVFEECVMKLEPGRERNEYITATLPILITLCII